jgi:hypothetical protein
MGVRELCNSRRRDICSEGYWYQTLQAETGPEPEFAFLQNIGACAAWDDGHEWRAIRTQQYTYAVYRVDGKELLFDNEADPYQEIDLIAAATSAEPGRTREHIDNITLGLRGKMHAKMAELKDNFDASSFYREHWVSKDRLIMKTAKNP